MFSTNRTFRVWMAAMGMMDWARIADMNDIDRHLDQCRKIASIACVETAIRVLGIVLLPVLVVVLFVIG